MKDKKIIAEYCEADEADKTEMKEMLMYLIN